MNYFRQSWQENRVRLIVAALLAVALAFGILDPSVAVAGIMLDTAPDLKQIAEETKKALEKISGEVKAMGERALAEAKKTGDMSAELKPKVDEILVKQGELQARLQETERKLAKRTDDEKQIVKSIGARMVESPEYKAWLEAGGMRSVQSGFLYTLKAELTSTPTTDTTTVGVRPDEQAPVPGTQQRLTVRDLIMPGRTSSNMISYVRETGFTNNAAPVSEATARKPESSLTYEWVQSPVSTIAHFIKASKQILDDFLQLQSNIDGRLRYGVKLIEEGQLLKGSGSGNNLNGIYTQATAYSAPIAVPSPTKIDTLRLMLLQAELAQYPSTGIVLHPSDWAAIELTKDNTGAYIFANPQNLAQPALWGRPVVATQSMTVDTALVGAFRMGAQLFDREEVNIVIATQNEDDFVRNMITIRAEERLALAVYRPEAFIKNANLPWT
jgi:HK97 family phage major capsid protein